MFPSSNDADRADKKSVVVVAVVVDVDDVDDDWRNVGKERLPRNNANVLVVVVLSSNDNSVGVVFAVTVVAYNGIVPELKACTVTLRYSTVHNNATTDRRNGQRKPAIVMVTLVLVLVFFVFLLVVVVVVVVVVIELLEASANTFDLWLVRCISVLVSLRHQCLLRSVFVLPAMLTFWCSLRQRTIFRASTRNEQTNEKCG